MSHTGSGQRFIFPASRISQWLIRYLPSVGCLPHNHLPFSLNLAQIFKTRQESLSILEVKKKYRRFCTVESWDHFPHRICLKTTAIFPWACIVFSWKWEHSGRCYCCFEIHFPTSFGYFSITMTNGIDWYQNFLGQLMWHFPIQWGALECRAWRPGFKSPQLWSSVSDYSLANHYCSV